MSSSDEIARLLNLGTADSHALMEVIHALMEVIHALMEVITEYFAESNVDPETDEEDMSLEGKQ